MREGGGIGESEPTIWQPRDIFIHLNEKHQPDAVNKYIFHLRGMFLHHKKRQIKLQLHLKCANTWRRLWHLMDNIIEDSLQHEMNVLYENLNKKLDNLQSQQEKIFNNNSEHKFYKRTVNLTPITFTLEEMELLNKGFELNIELPIEQYWNDLIIETEQAIRKLEKRD